MANAQAAVIDGGARLADRGRRETAGLPRHRFINLAQWRSAVARYESVQRHVIEARYLGDYKVWLEFNDGRKGVVDLADDLYGEHFELLRDRMRFADFYLDYGLATIAWHNGADFAPDYLYEKLHAMH